MRENFVHMSKYTIFRNRVQATQCTEILCIWVSILFLEIEFKQLNSILSWARVEKDQFNLNSNSDLSWVDFSQFNSTLTWQQIYVREATRNIHFNEKNRLHEQISMISVSAKLLFIMLMMMMLILLCHLC